MQRVHLLISGKVQGVWFRQSTQQRAWELGLTGWVRNLADGRVEVLAEGSVEDVSQLVAHCRQGPAMARVRNVVEEWAPGSGEFASFEVAG